MPRPIRGAGLACVAVVAVALLGGCSGSGEAPAGSPAAQNGALAAADPAALLASAADATFASGSTRFAIQMQVSSGGQATTASGAGSYDFARKVGDISVATTGTAAQSSQVDVIMDGATFYTRLPGQEGWTRTQAQGATPGGQQYDPAQQLDILQKVSSDVRLVGVEELRGEQVRHLTFTIDPASLAAASGMAGDGAAALQRGGPIAGDVYIDDAGRVRKLQTRMTMDIAGASTAMNVVSEYIEFGVPVTVQAPDPATVR
jgi:LppX_LprAFG lipoprotein